MTRPSMPSRKRIYNYWKDKIDSAVDENTCFKCGFTLSGCTAVERAHITSYYNSKDNSESNIHLLCVNCHKQSESFEGDVYNMWFNFGGSRDEFLIKLSANIYFDKIKTLYEWEELKSQIEVIVNNHPFGKKYAELELKSKL